MIYEKNNRRDYKPSEAFFLNLNVIIPKREKIQ